MSKSMLSPAPWEWVGGSLHDANGETVLDDGSNYGEYDVTISPNSANGRLVAKSRELIELATIIVRLHDIESSHANIIAAVSKLRDLILYVDPNANMDKN